MARLDLFTNFLMFYPILSLTLDGAVKCIYAAKLFSLIYFSLKSVILNLTYPLIGIQHTKYSFSRFLFPFQNIVVVFRAPVQFLIRPMFEISSSDILGHVCSWQAVCKLDMVLVLAQSMRC